MMQKHTKLYKSTSIYINIYIIKIKTVIDSKKTENYHLNSHMMFNRKMMK